MIQEICDKCTCLCEKAKELTKDVEKLEHDKLKMTRTIADTRIALTYNM